MIAKKLFIMLSVFSDDIVYARFMLRVKKSELAVLISNEEIYGIVNYLDKEGVSGITVLGDAIAAQTKVTRLYL